MALAGHASRLKISGAAVAVVAEAMTSLGAGVYQITNTAKRILNPAAATLPQFFDGGVPISSGNITALDLLFGKVTFSPAPAGVVTVTCEYLPVATLAAVKNFEFNADAGLVDATTYDSAGARAKVATLLDTSGMIEILSAPIDDIDPITGGTQTLRALLNAGTPKLVEIQLGSYYLRWWVVLENLKTAAEVAGLVETTADVQGQPQILPLATFVFATYSFGT